MDINGFKKSDSFRRFAWSGKTWLGKTWLGKTIFSSAVPIGGGGGGAGSSFISIIFRFP